MPPEALPHHDSFSLRCRKASRRPWIRTRSHTRVKTPWKRALLLGWKTRFIITLWISCFRSRNGCQLSLSLLRMRLSIPWKRAAMYLPLWTTYSVWPQRKASRHLTFPQTPCGIGLWTSLIKTTSSSFWYGTSSATISGRTAPPWANSRRSSLSVRKSRSISWLLRIPCPPSPRGMTAVIKTTHGLLFSSVLTK